DAMGDVIATGTIFQYGGSIAFIFDVADDWAIGVRGEHLSGNDNYRDFGDPDNSFGFLWTGTLTIRYMPVEYLVLSLEGRVEGAGEDIYFTRSSSPDPGTGILQPNEKIYGAVILGVSGHIGN
ncbi:MAG: porin, partial [Myxococcales bacterium]|nr:porin [Myxococcales bacterium]